MDTTADNITFDENGYCNYCTDFIRRLTKNHSISEYDLKIKRDL
jgi:hypothetical protein